LRFFHNWSRAQLKIGTGAYNDIDFASYIAEKTRIWSSGLSCNRVINKSELDLLMFFSNRRDESVLDIGGGMGTHFFLVRSFIPNAPCLADWRILETDSVVHQSELIGHQVGLRFFNSMDRFICDLKPHKSMLLGSSLQYFPDPVSQFEQLLNLLPQRILISRTPVSLGPETLYFIQKSKLNDNGPQVSHSELGAILETQQYKLLRRASNEIKYVSALIPLSDLKRLLLKFEYRFMYSLDSIQSPLFNRSPFKYELNLFAEHLGSTS
jgi:putative methyltransferase (TIGR04325 family)